MTLAILPLADQQTLERCEATIREGLQTFIEVGEALATIRDGRLYRAEHPTFEAYCQDRWGFTRSRAAQLIDAGQIAREMSTMVDNPPANERQARALSSVAPEERAEVLAAADALAGDRPRTAEHIRQAARRDRTAADAPEAVDTAKLEKAERDTLAEAAIVIERGQYALARMLLERVKVLTAEAAALGATIPAEVIAPLPLDLQNALVALGAAIGSGNWITPPKDSGEASGVYSEAEARAAAARWSALKAATPAPSREERLAANLRMRISDMLDQLAPLMMGLPSADPELLALAIEALHACREGDEAAHWIAVGRALIGDRS